MRFGGCHGSRPRPRHRHPGLKCVLHHQVAGRPRLALAALRGACIVVQETMLSRTHALLAEQVPGHAHEIFRAALPEAAAGRWCRFDLGVAPGMPRVAARWWAKLELTDEARGQVVREVFLGKLHRRGLLDVRTTLVHVPQNARALMLHLFPDAPPNPDPASRTSPNVTPPAAAAPYLLSRPTLSCKILSRGAATASLLAQGWRSLPAAAAGAPAGVLGRIRAVLGQGPARAGQAPSYATWIALYEHQPAPAACAAAASWDVQIVIVAGAPAATQASIAAAAAQHPREAVVIVRAGEDWPVISADWVIVLQAGEILAPGAVAWFAEAALAQPAAQMLIADYDRLGMDGIRTDPLFKPTPDKLLLRSGLLTRGACALRWRNIPAGLAHDAGQLRLAKAGQAIAQAPAALMHIPRILSHIRPDCRVIQTPAAASVDQSRTTPEAGHDALDDPSHTDNRHSNQPYSNQSLHGQNRPDNLTLPGPASPRPASPEMISAAPCCPSVTILIPSAARSPHVLKCVKRVAAGTAYPDVDIRIVLSAPQHAGPAILRRLAKLPHVSTMSVDIGAFNYALVNNAAAAQTCTPFLLLMNDDVAPAEPAWLAAMMRHMQDPAIGIVGARLLYGNGMVQHEGVIMGLANLCEHAGRLRAGTDPGPHRYGMLDRQVSAVTGACLLIRTALYKELGGMDGAYAVALNDVDLCLRAREAGWGVVYCADATLYHFESLSLGRHYAGARASRESFEVRRLRSRFADVIADDPFYSPLASLQPGREWQPGFPPRAHARAIKTVEQP
jgi:GT2 family glycosyltransferase